MGCFNSTCAFTRTAIDVDDEVLLVAVKTDSPYRETLLETNILLNQCATYERAKQRGDYGFKEYELPFRFIGVGIYNNEGSIEGYNNDIPNKVKGSWWDYQFFVHRGVAEGILGRPLDPSNQEQLEGDTIKLVRYAHQARVQLKGNHLVGEQSFDDDEIALQRKILSLANQILDKHQEYLDDPIITFYGTTPEETIKEFKTSVDDYFDFLEEQKDDRATD